MNFPTRHLRKCGLSMGLGRLPGPRLYVVRQTGLFSRRRSIEFGEDGRGLLRVSFEICVLYAVWSLAPTYFMGSVVSYAAAGSVLAPARSAFQATRSVMITCTQRNIAAASAALAW